MSNAAMSPMRPLELSFNSGQKGGVKSKDNSRRFIKEDGGNDLYNSFNSPPEEAQYNNPLSPLPPNTPNLTLVDNNSISPQSNSPIKDTLKTWTGIKKFGAKAMVHRFSKYGLHTFPNSAEKESFKLNGYSLTPTKNGNDDLHNRLQFNESQDNQSSEVSNSENNDVINTNQVPGSDTNSQINVQESVIKAVQNNDQNQQNIYILSPQSRASSFGHGNPIKAQNNYDYREHGLDSSLFDEVHSKPEGISETDQRELITGIVSVSNFCSLTELFNNVSMFFSSGDRPIRGQVSLSLPLKKANKDDFYQHILEFQPISCDISSEIIQPCEIYTNIPQDCYLTEMFDNSLGQISNAQDQCMNVVFNLLKSDYDPPITHN